MSPYYKSGCCFELSGNDTARVVELYGAAAQDVGAPAEAAPAAAPASVETPGKAAAVEAAPADAAPAATSSAKVHPAAPAEAAPAAEVQAKSCCCSTM